MNLKKLAVCLSIIFFLGSGFVFTQKARPKKKEMEVKNDMIRLRVDLIEKNKGSFTAPSRNIFFPQAVRSSVIEKERVKEETAVLGKNGQNIQGQIVGGINLRYIGYVHSREKTTALIIFQGEAIAVDPGDFLNSTLKVGKVSPQEIEIISESAEPVIIPLEGEET